MDLSFSNRSLWIAALVAGVAMAVLSTIPFISALNCLLCAWLWLGGIFAVWYYKRSNPGFLTTSQGATIGAIAGLIGAVIGTILGLVVNSAGVAAQLAAQAEAMGDAGGQIVTMLAGGLGVVIGLILNLILYTLFGAIGGFIGASIFKPKVGTPPSGGAQTY